MKKEPVPFSRAGRWLRKFQRTFLNRDPSFCDMYTDARLRADATVVLEHIRRHSREVFGEQRLAILDAGCQAGRLLIPLAQDGHRLTGIDTSGFALRRARRHARALRLDVRVIRGDMARISRWVSPEHVDLVICANVLYLRPNYRHLLTSLRATLKPGGLACVTHRSQVFQVAEAMHHGRAAQAHWMMTHSEHAATEPDYGNWHTPRELGELYHALRLQVRGCYPIERFAFHLPHLAAASAEVHALLTPFQVASETYRVHQYELIIAQHVPQESRR